MIDLSSNSVFGGSSYIFSERKNNKENSTANMANNTQEITKDKVAVLTEVASKKI
jgi:hypothetical protein